MAYASSIDFANRYDSRLLQQLSVDDNSTSIGGTVISALLDDAQAEILTATLKGSIYTAGQLTALVAAGDTALMRLNCDLALKLLVGRRVGGIPSFLADIIKRAEDMLEALRSGERVLNIVANRGADMPSVIVSTGLQQSNAGDITQSEFWSNRLGTNTVDAPGT
jgi:phage gp36-like protein